MNPNELAYFEQLVYTAYSDRNERIQASDALSKFAELEFWKQNLFVLQQSKNPYALLFAATHLRNALTNYSTSFTSTDKLELRQTMLKVLADLGDQFWGNNTVRPVLVECFCRLQKLCWFDSNGPSNSLISEVMPFLKHSLAHSIIGINLFQQLVVEMSNTLPTLAYATQRKIAVVFREKCLLDILSLGLQSLSRILQAPQPMSDTEMSQQNLLKKEALELINQVLNFDFIGTSPDATSDDVGVIHVPESWAPFFEDKDTLGILFGVYDKYGPPYSTKTMEVLVQFSGVRNSVFHTDETRIAFMNQFVDGLGKILVSKKDLDHPENTHQLARLLTRLKGNYQLKHVLEASNYTHFIQKVAEFSIEVFRMSANFNSVFYIVNFWSRMVAANSLLKLDLTQPTRLNELVPVVLQGFVTAQISHVTRPIAPEEALDTDQLRAVLDEIPGMVKCTYNEVAGFLLNGLRSVAQTAQPLMAQSPGQQLAVIEKQLAWMIYVCAAVLGAKSGQGDDDIEALALEAQLVVTMFECLQMSDNRMQQQQAKTPGTRHIELAFISFLQKFCKHYLTESTVGTPNKVYELMGQHTDLSTSSKVIERIVQKILLLLKAWASDTDIIEQTLGPSGLFWALATGFSSSKLMGKSQIVSHLLEHPTEIIEIGKASTRRAFYKTLGRLLFGVNSTTNFYSFIHPFQQRLEQVKSNILTENRKKALELLCQTLSDLRGLTEAMYSKDRGFSQFFDWFYTETGFYDWLAQILTQYQQLQLECEDCWPIILFCDEFCNNQHRRVQFPLNSADGIRLFRTTAHILIQFASFIMSARHSDDVNDKFKSFKLFFRCLHRALTGGYTNFGVFEMYNDQILNDLLKVSCTLLLSLDSTQLEVHQKVFSIVYNVLDVIASNHAAFLIGLDTNAFRQLLVLCHSGLLCTVKTIISDSCSALDKIFSLHVSNLLLAQQNRVNPRTATPQQLEWMTAHVSQHQHLISTILIQLLNLIITTDGVHWFASKPLLALIFVSQKEFAFIQQMIISSQAQSGQQDDRAAKIAQVFAGLMTDIKMNLESENREKFTSNVTTFRSEIKQLLDLNAFYKAIVHFTKE